MINILLLCGGGSSEHEISLLSANLIEIELRKGDHFYVFRVEIKPEGWFDTSNKVVNFDAQSAKITCDTYSQVIDFVVPCIHGFPGETGDIQSLLELAKVPYLGCGPVASAKNFNKILSKRWYTTLGIPSTPHAHLCFNNKAEKQKALLFFERWHSVFVKAAKQGSSIGCYQVTKKQHLFKSIDKAFRFSSQVLVEKALVARELEVAAYEYGGTLHITAPGEIVSPRNKFYSYKEKYNTKSTSITHTKAQNLSPSHLQRIKEYSVKVFEGMNLRHLSRIDFFLTEKGDIYLNEVNTFPGMTSTSLFTKMLKGNGHSMCRFLRDCILRTLQSKL